MRATWNTLNMLYQSVWQYNGQYESAEMLQQCTGQYITAKVMLPRGDTFEKANDEIT